MPSPTPLAGPNLPTASAIYSEHVGQNRQCWPSRGENSFLYNRRRNNRAFFMSSASVRDRLQSRAVSLAQFRPGGISEFFLGDNENIHGIRKPRFVPSIQFPSLAPDPVSPDGVADLLACNRGHPGMGQPIRKMDQIEKAASRANAFFIKIGKIFFLADPLVRTIALYHQTARRFRPFCLRLLMTFCPPLVLMRTRKPWSFFLFLLFGWNVGFIVFNPQRKTC